MGEGVQVIPPTVYDLSGQYTDMHNNKRGRQRGREGEREREAQKEKGMGRRKIEVGD